MKKFSVALMAFVLCFTMVFSVAATDDAVIAEPEVTREVPTTLSTQEVVEDLVSGAIEDNKEEVDQATDSMESFRSTITKVLDALDKFLRSFGVFINQFLDQVLGNGSLPF